jgi:hypothetical protein
VRANEVGIQYYKSGGGKSETNRKSVDVYRYILVGTVLCSHADCVAGGASDTDGAPKP